MLRLALTLSLLASSSVSADDSLEQLAGSVAQARADVDTLSVDVDALRAEARDEQLALARRKTALESDLDVARMKGREIEARIAALEAQATERGDAGAPLVAPLQATLTKLRAQVARGIPFKVRERTGKLDEAERALQSEGAARALELVTAFIDSELEMGRTNARVRQPVTLEGKPVMADVVRLGRVAMIFRSKEGAVGYAASEQTWRLFDDPADRARAAALLDTFARPTFNGIVLVPRPALARAEATSP